VRTVRRRCSTEESLSNSRNAGVEPTVIEYLKTPPDRGTLESLIQRTDIRPRDLLRQKGTPYEELGLGADHWTDAQLIDQMLAHPILINRPIVVTPWGAKLCRPSEVVIACERLWRADVYRVGVAGLPAPQQGRPGPAPLRHGYSCAREKYAAWLPVRKKLL